MSSPPGGASLPLEEGCMASADPFRSKNMLRHSPPLARRPVSLGGGDDDPFLEDPPLDESPPTNMYNHSEAGPDIATGITSDDIETASLFFKEGSEFDSQFKKGLSISAAIEEEISEPAEDQPAAPPQEERSAPEGTASPPNHPPETPPDKGAVTAPPGYLSPAQVDALLRRQEATFEQRLRGGGGERGEEERRELAELRVAVVEVTQSREALLKMLEQYKDMLGAVAKDKGKASEETQLLTAELQQDKDTALDDLANVEAAFSDVHRKYERTKQVVETLRRNEETLRGALGEAEARARRGAEALETLQGHARDKMEEASEEYLSLQRSTDAQLSKMGALLKKAEMKMASLEEQLERKCRDNTELTQLLDDLIAKMGPAEGP